MIDFVVYGIPRSKGSKRAFVLPNSRRAVVVEQTTKHLKPWLSDLKYQAQQQITGSGLFPMSGPLGLSLEIAMPKPKSHPKRTYRFMVTRPDVDKIKRGVLDALKSIVYLDDAQLVYTIVSKAYGDRPGVHIRVWPWMEEIRFDWS